MKPLRQGGFLIAKIHQLAGRLFSRRLKSHGLQAINPAQGRILFALWQQAPLTISDLARRTALGKSTLTAMLDRLEADGLVARAPSPEDRRETLILRTMKDEAFRESFLAVSEEMTHLFYDGFGAEEIDLFERLLARILANLESAERRGEP